MKIAVVPDALFGSAGGPNPSASASLTRAPAGRGVSWSSASIGELLMGKPHSRCRVGIPMARLARDRVRLGREGLHLVELVMVILLLR